MDDDPEQSDITYANNPIRALLESVPQGPPESSDAPSNNNHRATVHPMPQVIDRLTSNPRAKGGNPAWVKGYVANPKGRPPGRNRATVEAREASKDLLCDPAYRASLRQRLLDGTAGAMEALLWLYAHGRPADRPDPADGLKALTNDELRERLVAALDKLA